VAQNGGDRGDWTLVQSTKRKATQAEAGRRDRSRVSKRQGGTVSNRVWNRCEQEDFGSFSRYNSRIRTSTWQQEEGRVSKVQVQRSAPDNRRDSKAEKEGSDFRIASATGSKVAFYFTNFPDSMFVFQLRQYFEVCGILSDLYIARKRNLRGQYYSFLRFVNVINVDKLALALKCSDRSMSDLGARSTFWSF